MAIEKVFGIGLNKTGTTSLRQALKQLGFRHLDRQPRLFKAWRAGDLAPILEAADAFESFEDWPWPLIVPELLDRYGDRARFVLTLRRTPLAWVESLKRHAERTNPDHNPRRDIYGYDYPHGAEGAHIAFYHSHAAQIRHLFSRRGARHLLLECAWDAGDGWAELCRFLGRPVPHGGFPHANAGGNTDPDPEMLADNLWRITEQRVRLASEAGNIAASNAAN